MIYISRHIIWRKVNAAGIKVPDVSIGCFFLFLPHLTRYVRIYEKIKVNKSLIAVQLKKAKCNNCCLLTMHENRPAKIGGNAKIDVFTIGAFMLLVLWHVC